jgi:hypothetical protein
MKDDKKSRGVIGLAEKAAALTRARVLRAEKSRQLGPPVADGREVARSLGYCTVPENSNNLSQSHSQIV